MFKHSKEVEKRMKRDKMLESATMSLLENKSNKNAELARIYEHEGNFFDRLNKDHVKDRMSRLNKTREQVINRMKKGTTTRPEVIEYYEANQELIDRTASIDPEIVDEDFVNLKKIIPKIDFDYKNPKRDKVNENDGLNKSRSLTPLKKSLQASVERLSRPKGK
jgi:hypothetical protein